MRKTLLSIISLCIGMILQAQVFKTVDVTAGGLSSALTSTEKTTVTNLVVTGTIDARDFKTMRDEMNVLSVLDIGGVDVTAYTGTEGTYSTTINSYPADGIPDYAFFFSGTNTGKTSLKDVTFPESITVFGISAFNSCNGLTSVHIPSRVTSIGSFAFHECTGLSGSLIIPSSVISVGDYAFFNCVNIYNDILISSHLLEIGIASFSGIRSGIQVETRNPNYSSQYGVLYNKTMTTLVQGTTIIIEYFIIPSSVTTIGAYAFFRCTDMAAVNIPSSVTSIENCAFLDCSRLVSVRIPSSVTNIGNYAFSGCTALSSIYTYRTTPVDLSLVADVFYNVNKNTCTLLIPEGSETPYQGANQWTDFVNIVEIGAIVSKSVVSTAGNLSSILTGSEKSTVTNLILTGTIDARDFKIMRDNMPILAVIDISGVTVAGYTGTEGTKGTSNTVYPANTIPANAFYNGRIGKYSLTNITLPTSGNSIGSAAFYNCIGLSAIVIPTSVTSIAYGAFRFCTGLISATLPEGLSTIGEFAFSSCSSLTSINIPSSVNAIARGTFRECSSLTTVIIQDGINSIGEGAFENCTKLTSINFPSSVTSIEAYAFYGCTELRSIIFPSTLTLIGSYAFLESGLEGSIILPDNVMLYSCVFKSCIGITEFIVNSESLNYSDIDGVLFNKGQTTLIQYPGGRSGEYVIPGSVINLEVASFYQCSGLNSLTIPETVEHIRDWAFGSCTGLASIYCHANYPPPLYESYGVFSWVDKTTCTLYIPQGSKANYQSATEWKTFNNIVEFFTTDLELINSIEIKTYPNPVTDNLTIEIKGYEVENLEYQLYDIKGNLLLSKKADGTETIIDVSEYGNATYFLKVTENNKILKTFKILKNR